MLLHCFAIRLRRDAHKTSETPEFPGFTSFSHMKLRIRKPSIHSQFRIASGSLEIESNFADTIEVVMSIRRQGLRLYDVDWLRVDRRTKTEYRDEDEAQQTQTNAEARRLAERLRNVQSDHHRDHEIQ